jgi:hypothetical protein
VFLASSARPADYWADSQRPLSSLVFLLPLLGLYEFGAMGLGAPHVAAIRKGADVWMRGWLLEAGLDRPWVLPLLIVGILIGWHLIERRPWKVSPETIVGMGAESLLGAVLLLVVGQMLSLSLHRYGWDPPRLVDASLSPETARAIGFLGAGIYEEVLFRLLMLPGAYFLLRAMLLSRRLAVATAILTTSSLFALAHYLEPGGETIRLDPQLFVTAATSVIDTPHAWFGFGFRLLAGLVFACLFVVRGFGITVGCHVVYDLLVGVVIANQGQ